MISSIHLLSLALLYPAFSAASKGFVAYGDFNCQDQKLDVWSDGVPVPDSTLLTDYSIKDWNSHAGGHYYDNLTFSEAAKTNHTLDEPGIQVVWWKVEEPDPTCQLILMKNSPRGWQVLNKLPGDEILRASRRGCYYSALRPEDSLIASFCCGRDDCAIAEIEKQQPKPKNTANGDAPTCSLLNTYSSTPTIEDGTQIGITRSQSCEVPPACTHSISQSQSFSTAVSHFQSYTWTTEEGFDVSFESGVDFLVEDRSKLGISLNVAQSFMDETGTTLTVANISTATEGNRQLQGTLAFYSFTPQYNCWKGDVGCGKDKDGKDVVLKGINFCQPILSSTGDTAGVFRMVYTSDDA
ncbi:hypothetical protein F4781DRAFT_317377 [Annulohypoxylon bovei var. microspora]|nr:hypothetical protein F4781DRAFT_317377 [Annulohypoxylon bovei var. microspora]